MRIKRACLEELGADLAAPAEGGRRRWISRRGLRLRLSAGGKQGMGDAAPLPDYSSDTLEDTRAALSEFCASAADFSDALPLEQAISRCLAPIPRSLPAARFAVETALLDLRSRLLGVPVHVLLGGCAEPRVGVAALAARADTESTLEWARHALADGAAALKMKFVDDADWVRIESLRREFPSLPLRVDFNQSALLTDVPAVLARAASLGVELVEEPWPDVGVAPRLAPGACPAFVDESLRDVEARARVTEWLHAGRISGAVLKPALLGGSLVCLDLARRVRAAGGQVFVTHLFDGPVALAAAAELALVLGGPHAHGLGPHPALALGHPFRAFAVDGYRLAPHAESGLGSEASS